jgi:hypothetical protein
VPINPRALVIALPDNGRAKRIAHLGINASQSVIQPDAQRHIIRHGEIRRRSKHRKSHDQQQNQEQTSPRSNSAKFVCYKKISHDRLLTQKNRTKYTPAQVYLLLHLPFP